MGALVFIGGVPYSDDSSPILREIEQEYGIKFANHLPVRIKVREVGYKIGFICPIPLQSAEMATKLCNNSQLRLSSRPDLNMHVRKFYTKDHAQGSYQNY